MDLNVDEIYFKNLHLFTEFRKIFKGQRFQYHLKAAFMKNLHDILDINI